MSYGAKPEEKKVLEGLQWGQFKQSDNNQLLPIRQLELFKKRSEVANNATLKDAVKQAQLKELDAELAKLEQRMAEREKQGGASAG